MGDVHMKLEDIIEATVFQHMQDQLSKATDLAILTVDFKGVPITEHSFCKAFCALMRKDPQSRDLCQKCDSRGGIEAARLEAPYIYMCHQGLVDLAVPIMANGQYLGAIMAGQVQMASPLDEDKLEIMHMRTQLIHDDATEKKLLEYKKQLPVMTYEKVKAIGHLLFEISQLYVERALLRHTASPLVDKKTVSAPEESFTELSHPVDPNHIEPNPYVFLNPAFKMLGQHIEKRFSVDEMAALCNVSVSYFSKCFSKATGMRFAAYQNQIKIQAAEMALKTTNRTITEISDNLGFESPSYFIKTFKQRLGVTPSNYRQRYLDKLKVEHK